MHEIPEAADHGWDSYWKGIAETGAWQEGGAPHPAVRGFWGEFFESAGARFERVRLVDIGSGNGALVEYALAVLDERLEEIHCVDSSESAIASIGLRFPQVRGHIADAGAVPLESGRFDIVTSQFGAEHAGPEAFEEAARLLAENGLLAVLAYSDTSQFHHQNEVDSAALERVRECGFLQLARQMFEAGFEALRGADRAAYEQAAERLGPAVAELEGIMTEHGQNVANDTIALLYGQVASFHSRMQHYDPDEVLAWLSRMESELDDHRARISSMLGAAIGQAGFRAICETLADGGLTLEQHGPLLSKDGEVPLAWAILASKEAMQ